MGWMGTSLERLLALAVFLVVTTGEPTYEENIQEDPDNLHWPTANGSVLAKTVVSDRMRLVFAVGLEGSGHHMLKAVFTDVFENNTLPYVEVCPLAKAVYPGLVASLSKDPHAYAEAHARLVRQMKHLAISEKELEGTPGTMTTLQFHHSSPCSGIGMMSYPNYAGEDKVLQYVDLPLLVLAAETEGVDLRLIYLSRSAMDVVISTTQHRAFDKGYPGRKSNSPAKSFVRYMQILITQATLILSMLKEVEPEFVVCLRYDSMHSDEQVAEVADFAAPNAEVAGMLAVSLKKIAHPKPATDREAESVPTYEDEEVIIMRLQEKIDELNAVFCHPLK